MTKEQRELMRLVVDIWDAYSPEDHSKLRKLERRWRDKVEACRRQLVEEPGTS